MKTIVFNPDWIAPETVVKENLLPPLREGNYSILRVPQALGELQRQAGGPDAGRLEPRQYSELHLLAKGRARTTISAR